MEKNKKWGKQTKPTPTTYQSQDLKFKLKDQLEVLVLKLNK